MAAELFKDIFRFIFYRSRQSYRCVIHIAHNSPIQSCTPAGLSYRAHVCEKRVQAKEGPGRPVLPLGRTDRPPAGPEVAPGRGPEAWPPGALTAPKPRTLRTWGVFAPEGLLAKEEPLFRNKQISLRTVRSACTAVKSSANSCCLKAKGVIINVEQGSQTDGQRVPGFHESPLQGPANTRCWHRQCGVAERRAVGVRSRGYRPACLAPCVGPIQPRLE